MEDIKTILDIWDEKGADAAEHYYEQSIRQQ